MKTARKTFQIYWQHTKRYPISLAVSLLMLPIVTVAGSLLIPLLYADIIDQLATGAPFSAYKSQLLMATALFMTGFAGWRVIGFVFARLEARVMRDLTRTAFNWVQAQSYGFHVNHFGGAIVTQSKRFVSAYENLFDTLYFNIGLLSLRLLLAIGALLFIAPWVALVMILWTTFFVASVIYLTYRKRHISKLASAADTHVTARSADSITNILNVKIFASDDRETEGFDAVTQDQYKKGLRNWYFNEYIFAWQSFLMFAFEIGILTLSIYLVTNGFMTLGELVLIQFFLFPILTNLWELSRVARNIERAFSDAVEMTEILGHQPTVKDPENPEPSRIRGGAVRFDKVVFGYQDGLKKSRRLFNNFDLEIASGEKVGLVGASGGGKTTITKLLLRFMDIDGGAITLDGQNIAAITQSDLRGHIAYVPQEPILFHRSLLENIRYGNPNATDAEVKKVAKRAHAAEFIEKLDQGYNTLVGERGVKLSGGEKQRVAIARAILKDAPVLILDEATSSLDTESEQYIQESLDELMKNRTTLVIAHRLSTIQKMDRILVLDQGKIAEAGSHQELLAKKGKYFDLWQHQSGAFLEE